MCKVIDAVRENGGGNFSVKEIMVATSKQQHEHNLRMEEKMDAFEKTNLEAHEKLGDKIEETAKRKVSNTTFQLVVSIVMVIVGGMATLILTTL